MSGLQQQPSSAFVSYSRSDTPAVEALEQRLAADRVAFWRDQERIYGGDRWPKMLGEAIAANDVVLLIWSKDAAKSHYVEFEWCTASALKKRIISWLIDSTPLHPSLSALHGYDASRGEPALAKLLKALDKKTPPAEVR